MNRTYHLHQSFKTKFLNVFRRAFTIPFIEKFMQKKMLQNSTGIYRKLIPSNYLYKRGSYRQFKRGDINYKLDISNVVDHLLYFGISDSDYTSILPQIKAASVILDIGGNIGTTALYFASINQKCRILSFEPHPDTFKRAKENLGLNNFKNVEVINIGLGERKEKLKLYEVNQYNPGMNRVLTGERNFPYKEIFIEKLDDFLVEKGISRVDIMKIDVEGFELSVLKGGNKIIRLSKPILFIELDDDNLKENGVDVKMLIQWLQDTGYKNIYRADDLTSLSFNSDFSHCHFDMVATFQ